MSGAGDGATGLVLRVLDEETRPAADQLGLWVLGASLGLGLVLVLVFVALLEWSSALARRRSLQRAGTLGEAAARMGQPVTAATAVGSLIVTPRRGANPSAAVLLSSSPPPERLLDPSPTTIVLPATPATAGPRSPQRRAPRPPPRPLPPSGSPPPG